jgi:hypothetical protein
MSDFDDVVLPEEEEDTMVPNQSDDIEDGDDDDNDTDDHITVTVYHHNSPHTFTLPSDSSLQDLSWAISAELRIAPENQKLLITPKPGLQKPPFPTTTRIADSLPLSSPKFKIVLLGSQTEEIEELNSAVSRGRRRLEARSARPPPPVVRRRPGGGGGGGVHTLSSPSTGTYTFHRLLPLSYLPRSERSLAFLARLRDDPGIRAAMAKHRFSVPVLMEMDPALHTTHESRTLGLNRNKGEAIELRLRTDAYDGYRDYRTIRRTLCHELAHCVHSEHDRAFWDLTKQIEAEVERGDWTRGGHSLSREEFYNPDDWESESQRQAGDLVDHGGWNGGEFVLGGGGGPAAAESAGLSRREILARAAEDRQRRRREHQSGGQGGGEGDSAQ